MKKYTRRSRTATRNTISAAIVCGGCGWSGHCYCPEHLNREAADLLRAFLAAGDCLDKRRRAIADMKDWHRLDRIRCAEEREEQRLLAAAHADKTRRMRGLTDGRIGGHLALTLHRRLMCDDLERPEPITAIARRYRLPLALVKTTRDKFLRRTAFAAAAAPAPIGPDTRRLLQLGTTLLAVSL
jgi:hypothetical protein